MSCSASGRGTGSESGMDVEIVLVVWDGRSIGPSGVELVGATFMYWDMRAFTDFGVTLEMVIKAGRRSTVVGDE